METATMQMNVIDEKEIFVDEITVMHNPNKFFMDLKNITPRNDLGNNRMVSRHQVVIMDPFLAKRLLEILETNVKNYEKTYGKIEKSKQMEIAEKLLKKDGKENEKPEAYFG